jgi:demethoxyubiquinone hydroxylase (CLK1/Coq7/Cat5 family)
MICPKCGGETNLAFPHMCETQCWQHVRKQIETLASDNKRLSERVTALDVRADKHMALIAKQQVEIAALRVRVEVAEAGLRASEAATDGQPGGEFHVYHIDAFGRTLREDGQA